ncbi:MAG: tetratricopeptide repeat protein [Rhodospirillaceae bacterium]
MDIGFLTLPLTLAAMAFGLAVISDNQTVHIDHISVPGSISGSSGYTPEVVINRLADEMHEIERQAKSRAQARAIQLQGEKSAVIVLADFLKVTPLIRVAQETAGLIPFSFNGEIVARGHELELVLRGFDEQQKAEYIQARAPADQMSRLIKSTAYEAMRVIDPYILAAYEFKKDFKTRDFTPTVEIIKRQLADGDARYHKWMYNLWGMVLYQQADRVGAIEKFQAALAIDPNFASPMLNWGVVLVRQGNNLMALEKFRTVVANRRSDPPLATLAGVYNEWGFALALLGRYDEAFAKFRLATLADPGFAEVYSSWAEVLSALGRSDDAAKMTAISLKLAPNEMVYTENLVGAVQNLPATASVAN